MKKKKSPKWNLETQIKGALRKVFKMSPQHKECMENSVHPTIHGPKGGKRYMCAICKNAFEASEVQVDHLEEVIPLNKSMSEMTLDEVVARMFCSSDKLQTLCKGCHKIKTKEERLQRKILKNENKN